MYMNGMSKPAKRKIQYDAEYEKKLCSRLYPSPFKTNLRRLNVIPQNASRKSFRVNHGQASSRFPYEVHRTLILSSMFAFGTGLLLLLPTALSITSNFSKC